MNYHSDIRIVAETRLADDGEVSAFPAISVVISEYSMRGVVPSPLAFSNFVGQRT